MDIPPLTVIDLHKSYGDFPVLRGLDLIIQPNAIMGLVGLNGSGKTTTIECLLGLQRFNSGSVNILDHGPDALHRLQGDVVSIFDSPSLYANLTVGQCLQHAALLCPRPVRSVQEVEALLSIERFHDFKVRHLSLGNKRRASIAHALLGNPKFILLDEPLAGIDPIAVRDIRELVTHLKDRGIGVLITDHNVRETLDVVDRAYILHDGQVLMEGRPDEIVANSEVRRVYLGDRFSL